MELNKTKTLETLIGQAEQITDIKNDILNRISNLRRDIEEEQAKVSDYSLREETLCEDILLEAKDLEIIEKNEIDESSSLDQITEFIQLKLSKTEIQVNKNYQDEQNIIHFEKHKLTKHNILNKRMEEFDLTVRTSNILHNEEIKNIADLIARSEEEILQLPNSGIKTYKELLSLISNLGLSFSTQPNLKTKSDNPILNKGIEKAVNEVLEELSPWERHMIKYRYGLEDSNNLSSTSHFWQFATCYRHQRHLPKHDPLTGERIHRYSETTVRNYIRKALRKLRHPSRARVLKVFINNAIKIGFELNTPLIGSLDIGQALDDFVKLNPNATDEEKSQKIYELKDSEVHMSSLREHDTFYHKFICHVLGYTF